MENSQVTFRQAVELYNRREYAPAEAVCAQTLQNDPQFSNAWALRAAIARQLGDLHNSVDFISRAIELQPNEARYHCELGITFSFQGNITAAVASLTRAITLATDLPEAHFYLGNIFANQGQQQHAVAAFQKALQLKPNLIEAAFNLGKLYLQHGCFDDAIQCFQHAVSLSPNKPEIHFELATSYQKRGLRQPAIASYQETLRLNPKHENAHINLGNTLMEEGRLDEATICLEHAARLLPESAQVHNNLGYALLQKRQLDPAIAYLRRSIELQIDTAALNNLGIAFSVRGQLDEAVEVLQKALQLNPGFAGAHSNLGNALKDQGLLDEAMNAYRRALEIEPHWVQVHSNFLCTINPHVGSTAQAILDEHLKWDDVHARPFRKHIRPHENDRVPDRPLRIGYVSPDFCGAPVGRFMLPILEAHDRTSAEIFCYSSVRRPDEVTECCRRSAHNWREVIGQTDEQLAESIRRDKIDILIDLTMHMVNHRLLTFARKPAPVQATYLAYGGTTGLGTIDYRITDIYLDPPGQHDDHYSEISVRLPESYWCYRPVIGTPAVQIENNSQAKEITFGCLNNFCKVSVPTLHAWSQILREVSGSRLLIHAQFGSHRERVHRFFESQDISCDRVEFVPMLRGDEYFLRYHEIDIALDTFPFCGGTTTCDALWMGVPVVSLAGPRAVSRSGLSILSNIGLPDMVAHTIDEYAAIATKLAHDRARLHHLRATLRDRMQNSPLMNEASFTKNLENAYRGMWLAWCRGAASDGGRGHIYSAPS